MALQAAFSPALMQYLASQPPQTGASAGSYGAGGAPSPGMNTANPMSALLAASTAPPQIGSAANPLTQLGITGAIPPPQTGAQSPLTQIGIHPLAQALGLPPQAPSAHPLQNASILNSPPTPPPSVSVPAPTTAPSTAPGAQPDPPKFNVASTDSESTSPNPNMPIASPQTGVQAAPQTPQGHGSGSFLGKLLQAAPLALVALASRNNPQAGAALIGGYENQANYQQQNKQQQAAQAQARADSQRQQDYEDNIQQQEIDNERLKDEQGKPAALPDPVKELKALQGQPDAQSAYATFMEQHPDVDPTQALTRFQDASGKWLDHNPYVVPETAYQAGKLKLGATDESDRQSNYLTSLGFKYDGLAEKTHYDDLNAKYHAGELTVSQTRDAEQQRHDAITERLGGENAQTAWKNANTRQFQADNEANFQAYKENSGAVGGKAGADQSGKSIFGNPWGTTYDRAYSAMEKSDTAAKSAAGIIDAFQADPANKGKPLPQGEVDAMNAANANTQRYLAQVNRMQSTLPPTGKQTTRSMQGKPEPAQKGRVNPSVLAQAKGLI